LLNKSKYILYLRFLKVATLCLDDSFAHSWHSLNQLHEPQKIAAQINASQSSSNRHISTSTVQRRLCESGLHGQIAAKKPLLKDINKKKRLA
jgi:hypothetical protein